jgi:hypothetical protein
VPPHAQHDAFIGPLHRSRPDSEISAAKLKDDRNLT